MAKKSKKNEIPLCEINKKSPIKRYYHCRENLPCEEDDNMSRYYIVYSEVYGSYHLARFDPISGWKTIQNDRLSAVTHWCDDELFLPFPLYNVYDEEKAKEYGLTT